MLVTRLKLQNWMNFRDVDVPLGPVTYLLGPNASGKSNFLDAFRFLRDISKAGAGKAGGGIQNAVAMRHGVSKIRCLHARRQPDVEITVELSPSADERPTWQYTLGFTAESDAGGPLVTKEVVRNLVEDRLVLNRPSDNDLADERLRAQTHLEILRENQPFREIADFFSEVMYLHLVPQLLKYGEAIGGRLLEGDPFGQRFLELVGSTNKRKRDARLKRIEQLLALAVPRLQELRYAETKQKKPHLEARYIHHRPNAGWQFEDQFSDGTLRLIALLWALQSDDPVLLLEEPELSLNDEVVRQLPAVIDRLQRASKKPKQVIISTHSSALLSNPGIDRTGVLVITPGDDGSGIRSLDEHEATALDAGLSVSDVVLPRVAPPGIERMSQLLLFK